MVWLRKNDENIYEVVEGTFVKHRCKPTGKANKDRRDVSKQHFFNLIITKDHIMTVLTYT